MPDPVGFRPPHPSVSLRPCSPQAPADAVTLVATDAIASTVHLERNQAALDLAHAHPSLSNFAPRGNLGPAMDLAGHGPYERVDDDFFRASVSTDDFDGITAHVNTEEKDSDDIRAHINTKGLEDIEATIRKKQPGAPQRYIIDKTPHPHGQITYLEPIKIHKAQNGGTEQIEWKLVAFIEFPRTSKTEAPGDPQWQKITLNMSSRTTTQGVEDAVSMAIMLKELRYKFLPSAGGLEKFMEHIKPGSRLSINHMGGRYQLFREHDSPQTVDRKELLLDLWERGPKELSGHECSLRSRYIAKQYFEAEINNSDLRPEQKKEYKDMLEKEDIKRLCDKAIDENNEILRQCIINAARNSQIYKIDVSLWTAFKDRLKPEEQREIDHLKIIQYFSCDPENDTLSRHKDLMPKELVNNNIPIGAIIKNHTRNICSEIDLSPLRDSEKPTEPKSNDPKIDLSASP